MHKIVPPALFTGPLVASWGRMLHEQRTAMYRQRLALAPTAPAPGCGPHVTSLGRLLWTRGFDWEQVARAPALHLVQDGAGWLAVDGGAEQALAAGDAFLLVPGERARYREDPRRPWRYAWIGLAGEGARELLAQAGFAGAQRVLRAAATPRVWRLCTEIERVFAGVACSPFQAPALAWRLAEALAPDPRPGAGDPSLALRLLIDSGYEPGLGVDEAAARLGVDRTTLFRRFRRAYGCAPREYLRRARLERARDLLRRSPRSVAEVAAACGYGDPRAFARAYRAVFGCAPGEDAGLRRP